MLEHYEAYDSEMTGVILYLKTLIIINKYNQPSIRSWKNERGPSHMVTKKPSAIMTAEELEELLKEAVTPIDFEELVQAGVLVKRGTWYAIRKLDELPSHAKSKIKSIRQTKKNEVLVKFQAVSKRTEKLFKSYLASKKKK